MKVGKVVLSCVALFLAGVSFGADDEAVQPKKVTVRNIEFKNEGYDVPVNLQILRSHIQLKEGDEFKPFLTDSSIKSLYSTGRFDYVSVRVDKVVGEDNTCDVTFILTPKVHIDKLIFDGNKKFKNRKLKKEIKTSDDSHFDSSALKLDTEKLIKFYQDKGYPYADVRGETERGKDDNSINVHFIINEGPKAYIKNIVFNGAKDVKIKTLNEALHTKKRGFLSWLNGTGVYKPLLIEEDIKTVRNVMKNHGYVDAEISCDYEEVGTKKGSSLSIVFNIEAGQKYYVGDIIIKDNTIFSTEKLNSLLLIKTGDVFSPEAVDNSCEAIRDFYGRVGYLETFAQPVRVPNLETGRIDLEIYVHESEKFNLQDININGNHKTKNKVILRELALAPGDQFDLVRMKNSQLRLQNTGFFDLVDVHPEDSDMPGVKDMKVEVTEAKTGKVSVGGGISSGAQIMGFLELSQRNFDLFGKKSGFQGAGQKFRARVNIGRRTLGFNVNFEEPWFYDRELAVGTNLFMDQSRYKKSDRNYSGASYDEDRIGGELYARKRLFELVIGRLSYELQNTNIHKIGKSAPKSIRDEKGNTSKSSVSFEMSRDTRDNYIYPRNGSTINLDTELAGVGGETKFIKLETMIAKFWPTFEELEQVFMLQAKAGTITPFSHDMVPFFERYKLGGESYMKGFKSGDISPKENYDGQIVTDSGTSVGGDSMAYGCAEYTFKLAGPLRFYLFSELGFVNQKQFNFTTKNWCSDAGFGFKIFIMGAPLRLDFGFPLHSCNKNDHGMRFNYSFGMSF